jgi:hypothetical protein
MVAGMDRDAKGRFLPGQPGPGRSSTYRADVADRIIDAVANGGAIQRICEAEGVPIGTMYEWAERRPDFAQRLDQARLRRYDQWEDQLFEHAMAELGSDSMAAVQARRTLIDTMKWIMARRLPSKWSEAVTHQHLHQMRGNVEIRVWLPKKGEPAPLFDGRADTVELLEDGDSNSS